MSSEPCSTERTTVTLPLAASGSAKVMPVSALGVSSGVVKLGAETVGAWLTLSVSPNSKPSEPAPSPSQGVATAAVGAGAAIAAAGAAAMHGMGEKAEKAKESVADKVAAAAGKFDLDFHLDEAEKPAPIKPRAEPALATAAVAAAAAPAEKLARPAAALELDKLDLSFDPDKATFEDPTPSVLDGQWHDAATKLDLAKAYQEMGDVEGAREILQEVLHEGDDEQKKEAQAIIAKLG